MTRKTALSLPGTREDARTTVSPGSIRICWCARLAIRDSADIGSPCEPVETSTTCSGGRLSMSRRSAISPAGISQIAEVAGDAHVAHHRPADEGDPAVVRVRDVEHLLHPVHVGGEAGDDDPPARAAEDVVEHRADLALGRDEPGHLGVRRVAHQQVDALATEPGPAAEVGDPAVERQLVHLEVAGVQHRAGRGPDRHAERIRDRVVDREELARERPELLGLALPHLEGERLDPVLLQLALDQREGQPGADQRHVRLLAQQVRHRADVVLVAVGEDDRVEVVPAVPQVAEVGQDQVDAGLLGLGEQHAAVDDEQPAAVLEDRHVAADLADAAERDDAQATVGQWRWRAELRVRMAHKRRLTERRPAAFRSIRNVAISSSVASTNGGRVVRCWSTPSSCSAAFTAIAPWVRVMMPAHGRQHCRVDPAGFGQITGVDGADHRDVARRAGVADDADHPDRTDGQQRQVERVLAGVVRPGRSRPAPAVVPYRSPLASLTATICGCSASSISVSVAIGVPVRAGMS